MQTRSCPGSASKIRPKKAHQQIFGMLGNAHHSVSYCIENRMEDQIEMLSQLHTSAILSQTNRFVYGHLCKEINEIAQRYGCWTTDAPAVLENLEFDGKIAYVVVLSMIERALCNLDNKNQIQQMISPIGDLFSMLEAYGTPAAPEPVSTDRLAKSYALVAMMTYRNCTQGPGELDRNKAERQGLRSAERLVEQHVFESAPPMMHSHLYYSLLTSMASRYAHNQARQQNMQRCEVP